MKRLNKNKLIESFWEGNTSLNEDEFLKSQNDSGKVEKAYFNFLQKKVAVPVNLEAEIWKAIVQKQKKSKRLLIRWAFAATVISVIGLTGFVGLQERRANLDEQFALIEQTLNHVSNELTTTHSSEIIYEDDNIVIVAEN